jgi:2-C-methyl-D-erythritol 2,4-cyclodiphosphate synthase
LANKGRDSSELLREASEQVKRAGWHIVNLDCVVFAERPKILPHREKIREKIAEILGVNIELVWLKGKTGEGVGPVGQEQAISAECIAMIER